MLFDEESVFVARVSLIELAFVAAGLPTSAPEDASEAQRPGKSGKSEDQRDTFARAKQTRRRKRQGKNVDQHTHGKPFAARIRARMTKTANDTHLFSLLVVLRLLLFRPRVQLLAVEQKKRERQQKAQNNGQANTSPHAKRCMHEQCKTSTLVRARALTFHR
jgi:hypothetical protein